MKVRVQHLISSRDLKPLSSREGKLIMKEHLVKDLARQILKFVTIQEKTISQGRVYSAEIDFEP